METKNQGNLSSDNVFGMGENWGRGGAYGWGENRVMRIVGVRTGSCAMSQIVQPYFLGV